MSNSRVSSSGGRTNFVYRRDAFVVSVLDATVTVGAATVPFTRREMELIVLLASHRKPCSAVFLADLIYGQDATDGSTAAIKVFIHRIRGRVGSRLIVSGPRGYALAEDVEVDLLRYENLVNAARGRFAELSNKELDALSKVAHRLLAERPDRSDRWVWFATVDARLSNAGLDLWLEVADCLIRKGLYEKVIDLAKSLSSSEASCEAACDVAVRAYLALERLPDALEMFRRYRNALRSELHLEPSPALLSLIRDAQESSGERKSRAVPGFVDEYSRVMSSTRERTPNFARIDRT